MTCRDYYSKFVTELWWSVRLCIEGCQMRGMTEDVIAEGSMREWKLTNGNKHEVETKEQMKLKSGRSPDLFDSLVTGVEVARRRGFMIGKLSNKETKASDYKMRRHWREKARKLWSDKALNYSAN
jgi:hypothetical protein